jgi:DNA-binding NtrC family response regulator
LVESELFGHVKGSFSGAIANKKGAFQQADGGTLFLDELGDLPLSAQVKLLRALEGGDVRRVGSTEVEYPNVRIIAATNQNLHEQIEKGAFREDLLFRLQVLSIQLPPLRERVDDIALLIEVLCQSLNPSCQVSPKVLPLLKAYAWPGNIRELRNVLSRAYVMGQGNISVEHIELYGAGLVKKISEEKDLVNQELVLLFSKHKGNRSAMSRELGIPRTTLIYRLQQAGLR